MATTCVCGEPRTFRIIHRTDGPCYYNPDGWIGVDLDKTLAHYQHFVAPDDIGEPIAAMVERVKGWLAEGKEVRIFTARGTLSDEDRSIAYPAIERWCEKHIGRVLPITNLKDLHMWALWDDRAVQVEGNTGRPVCSLNETARQVLAINQANGWKCTTSEDWSGSDYKVPAVLALIHSEVSEALEDFRNNRREHFDEEIADVVIRCLDLAGGLGIDLDAAVAAKLEKNRARAFKHGGKRV